MLALVLLTGCLGAGIGQRFAGNQQFVLKQRASDLTLPPSAAVAVNGNETARQGASGGIVNVFYVGENRAQQSAGKTIDAAKVAATASASQNGDASNNSPANAGSLPIPKNETGSSQKPEDPSVENKAPPIATDLDAPAPPLSLQPPAQ